MQPSASQGWSPSAQLAHAKPNFRAIAAQLRCLTVSAENRIDVERQDLQVGCNFVGANLESVRMATCVSQLEAGIQLLSYVLTNKPDRNGDFKEGGLLNSAEIVCGFCRPPPLNALRGLGIETRKMFCRYSIMQ